MTTQYMEEDVTYEEWPEAEDDMTANAGDEIDSKTVSAHLQIEPVSYADECSNTAPSEASSKRPVRETNAKRIKVESYKVEMVLSDADDPVFEAIEVQDNEQDDDALKTLNVKRAVRKPRQQNAKSLDVSNGADVKLAKLPKMEQCEVCGFISRSLKTHMMTHTNEKKYECDFCGKKFALRSSMKNHLFAHVNIR